VFVSVCKAVQAGRKRNFVPCANFSFSKVASEELDVIEFRNKYGLVV
jgi:hypothetical protein